MHNGANKASTSHDHSSRHWGFSLELEHHEACNEKTYCTVHRPEWMFLYALRTSDDLPCKANAGRWTARISMFPAWRFCPLRFTTGYCCSKYNGVGFMCSLPPPFIRYITRSFYVHSTLHRGLDRHGRHRKKAKSNQEQVFVGGPPPNHYTRLSAQDISTVE